MEVSSSVLRTYVPALKSSCLFSWQCNIYMQLGYNAVGWMTEESWFDSWQLQDSCLQYFWTNSGAHPASNAVGTQVSFPIKAQACQTEHTAQSDAQVEEGSHTCSVWYAFMVCTCSTSHVHRHVYRLQILELWLNCQTQFFYTLNF